MPSVPLARQVRETGFGWWDTLLRRQWPRTLHETPETSLRFTPEKKQLAIVRTGKATTSPRKNLSQKQRNAEADSEDKSWMRLRWCSIQFLSCVQKTSGHYLVLSEFFIFLKIIQVMFPFFGCLLTLLRDFVDMTSVGFHWVAFLLHLSGL